MTDQIKLFLRLYFPVAAVLIALCYSFYVVSSRDILDHALLEDQSLTLVEEQLLVDGFHQFASDLITFASMQEWKQAFEDHKSTAFGSIVHELKTLLSTKKCYEKIRFIGLDGREVVRVDYYNGHPRAVVDGELQDKSERYYVAAANLLKEHQIYISPLDLNREHGVVEKPLKPVMRIVTPIVDAQGRKRGLLLFNILAEVMLERFMEKHVDSPHRSLLINRHGAWIHQGVMPKSWAFLLPNPSKQFRTQFPEAWKIIQAGSKGQFLNDEGMFTFRTIYPLLAAQQALPYRTSISVEEANQPIWKVMQYRNQAELSALTDPLAWRITKYTLLFLILLIPIVWRMVFLMVNRKGFEQRIAASERKFRMLIESLPDGVVVLQSDHVVYANKAAIRLFAGGDAQKLVGKPAMHFVHTSSQQLVQQRMQDVLGGKSVATAEERLLSADGTDLYAMVTPLKIEFEGKPAIQSVIRDISEQRKTECSLQISQQRYALFMEQTAIAVIQWDTDFHVVEWNNAAATLFGYSFAEAQGKHAVELLIPQDQRSHVDEIWQQFFVQDKGHHSIHKNVTCDAEVITCEWYNTPLLTSEGTVVGVMSLCHDVSERQRQQYELHKLQQAIEHAGESIVITDAHATIEYVNPAFSKITGYLPDEVLGQQPSILNSGHQDKSFYQRFWQKITSGETWHGSLVEKRKDGSMYPALMSVAPVFNEDQVITHFVAIQQDMSEHKELEDKFYQAQKMEALGTLVGGIAHDFNNVLASILGNLYLIKKEVGSVPKVASKIERIEHAGQHAVEMIRQMMTFSRKGKGNFSVMPVEPFLKEITKLVRTSIPENIVLQCEFGGLTHQIHGDGTQIQQILLNLVVNASHAVEGVAKPQITVSVQPYTPDDAFVFVYPEMKDKALLCIMVSDNGCGIDKENLDHVFEPFFTTKEEGKGTGLGLAMVYGAMQSHQGVIDIDSVVGQGTDIKLYFPLADSVGESLVQCMEVTKGEGETILIADDNQRVCEVMIELLQDIGYTVIAAENGKQAVQLFSTHHAEIGMVLLDIVMPVMDGIEAAIQLRQIRSDLPLLFLSGYEKRAFPVDNPLLADVKVLQKPIDITELSQQIHLCMKGA